MYAECSRWANWRRAFHTKISLFPNSLLNCTTCLPPHCHVAGHAILQHRSYGSLPDRSELRISAITLLQRSLTGCHEVLGKVFMVRLGMITLVSETRQNTSTDVKESTPQTTSQGYHSLIESPWSIRHHFWSTFWFCICVSAEKVTVPDWSRSKAHERHWMNVPWMHLTERGSEVNTKSQHQTGISTFGITVY